MLSSAAALALLSAFAWLVWRSLEQDQALANQRTQERLETAADLVAVTLQGKLRETQDRLTRLVKLPDDQLADGAARWGNEVGDQAGIVVISAGRVEAYPPTCLRYDPAAQPADEPQAAVCGPSGARRAPARRRRLIAVVGAPPTSSKIPPAD